MTPGLVLGMMVACLHWWQFDRLCNNLGDNLMAGRVVQMTIQRWGGTFLLGMLCLRIPRVTSGQFLAGFIAVSFAARLLALVRQRVR